MSPHPERTARWAGGTARMPGRGGDTRGLVVEGKLPRRVGLTLEGGGCRAAIGDARRAAKKDEGRALGDLARVVGGRTHDHVRIAVAVDGTDTRDARSQHLLRPVRFELGVRGGRVVARDARRAA